MYELSAVMASIHLSKSQNIIFFLFILFFATPKPSTQTPTPNSWPQQFHSISVMNSTTSYSVTDLWYDYPKGRNFNIIQKQLGGPPLYDLEWNNGTSFYYTLASPLSCRTLHFDVGILPPNWLDGANYLGQEMVDGFLCNVWEKVDFIWYYEDVVTKRPVYWRFYTGMSVHVITFEVGAVLEDSKWQAPSYCFHQEKMKKKKNASNLNSATMGNFMERLAKL